MSVTETSPMAVTTHDLPVGDHTVHVNTSGDPSSPAVLWLHGSGPGVSALSNWEHLLTSMAGPYYNVAPDLIGFGESSHPEDLPRGMAATADLRVASLIDLLDVLGLERVHVVGNSMGGMIATKLVQAAPGRVDRVVLMGSAGAPSTPQPALIRMVTFYDDPTPEAMRELLTSFVYDQALFGDRLDEIAAERVAKATRPEVKRSHLATFDRSSPPVAFTPEELGAIEHQVLVINGREDQLIPAETGLYLATHLPNARLFVLPHAGHWVQIEAADRFQSVVELFLAGSV